MDYSVGRSGIVGVALWAVALLEFPCSSSAFAISEVERCVAGCRALYLDLIEACDDEKANCEACGGVWTQGNKNYKHPYFCAAYAGGIWFPPKVTQDELEACLAARSLHCYANAQAQYRACARFCLDREAKQVSEE